MDVLNLKKDKSKNADQSMKAGDKSMKAGDISVKAGDAVAVMLVKKDQDMNTGNVGGPLVKTVPLNLKKDKSKKAGDKSTADGDAVALVVKFFFLQKQGLRLLETGTQENIQAAKILFQEQLAIFEHHTPIYNIACCEALLGNSKDALVFLKKAVDAGFRDVNHIENDVDLKSLRHLDEYKAIVAGAAVKPVNASNSSSVPSTPVAPVVVIPEVKPEPEITKPEVKAPEIAVPTPSAPSAHEANLVALENMGFAERSKNLEALERAKGDIVVAVQLLVDAQRLYKWF